MAMENNELYKKYRPQEFADVVGQPRAVKQISGWVEARDVPHTILLTGGSGCGKTTLARILAKGLRCNLDIDYKELNCADVRGIDNVREIIQQMGMLPMGGRCRVWLIDEAQKLTNDAQNAFLKPLEDTPSHVYFILATTDPGKLIATIKTRCTEVKLENISPADISGLVADVADKEGLMVTEKVTDKIVLQAEGSPRKALVLLDSIKQLKGEAEQLATITANDFQAAGYQLAQVLIGKRPWSEAAALLLNFKEHEVDAEGVRRVVLGFAQSCLIKNGADSKPNAHAAAILHCFRAPMWDVGLPGVTLAAYNVLCGK